ncbi:LCP family protein [Georgenia faecalis]|uniref:LCP family protein n=1 Tax=Georgenia faecalis TaxID=2483799 RepID=A0ABV9D675_9MICO|nr:LCP family protein [Georgenia faecalis]
MPRHARRRARPTWRRAVALCTTALVGAVAGGTAAVYAELQSGIERIDVADLVVPATPGVTPPPADLSAGQPLTVLLIGSDSRHGENAGLVGDGIESVLSDTTIVANISAGRDRVDLVSIPRDSMVDIPECRTTGGDVLPARHGMYNSAFASGWDAGGDRASAIACTLSTTQHTTGLTFDGYVLVEFTGFTAVVDAVGGVPICIPEDISSPKADLYLTAGQQVLDGPTATAYARARTGDGLGDGSDTMRIVSQQQLMSALASHVLSRNLLTDTAELYQFATAATRTLTTSPELGSVPYLTGLAFSLRNISAGAITFMTTPSVPHPDDPNRITWTDEAEEVWARIAQDLPVVEAPSTPPGDAPTGDAPTGSGDASTAPGQAPPVEAPSDDGGPLTAADAPVTCA